MYGKHCEVNPIELLKQRINLHTNNYLPFCNAMLIICQTLMTGYGLNSYHFVCSSLVYVYWTGYIGPLKAELKNGHYYL